MKSSRLIFIVLFLLITFIHLYSQFTVSGFLKGGKSITLYFSKFNLNSLTLLQKVKVNDDGSFHFSVKEPYIGAIQISPNQRDDLKLIFFSDNNDIQLEITYDEKLFAIDKFSKSEINQKFLDYADAVSKENANRDEARKIIENYPLLKYYTRTFEDVVNMPIDESGIQRKLEAIRNEYANAGDLLETSGLGPELFDMYIKLTLYGVQTKQEADQRLQMSIDRLLEAVDVTTDRGQTLLVSCINFFKSIKLHQQASKLIELAKGLKCQKNNTLLTKIEASENMKLGAVVPNYIFGKNLRNTKAKSLHDVQSRYKILMIWASWCKHCMSELPELKKIYPLIKQKGGEIIALSVDKVDQDYFYVVKDIPWITDSEILGWDSSYAKLYNVSSTPFFAVIDGKNGNKILANDISVHEILDYLK